MNSICTKHPVGSSRARSGSAGLHDRASGRPRASSHLLVLAALLLATAPAGTARAITANVADDICSPSTNPCVIDQHVDIADGAIIDFGLRRVEVTGNGQLDFNNSICSFRAGDIEIGGQGLKVVNVGDDGAAVDIVARSNCSIDTTALCGNDTDCSLGSCRTTCSNAPTRTCVLDQNCPPGGRCNGPRGCSRDTTNSCQTDNDCDRGDCILGTGDLTITGQLLGQSKDVAPSVFLVASGAVTLDAQVIMNGKKRFSDGGFLAIEAGTDATLNERIRLDGGGQASGGELSVVAKRDIAILGQLDLPGGDGGGGFVEIDAGRDLDVRASILAQSQSGEGCGGGVDLAAGGQLTVGPPPGSSLGLELRFSGSSANGTGGSGGELFMEAGGRLDFEPDVLVKGTGAPPDGSGAVAFMTSGEDMAISGVQFDLRGTGAESDGGSVELFGDENVSMDAGTSWQLNGGEFDSGDFEIGVANDLVFRGEIDQAAHSQGNGGFLAMDVGNSLIFGGSHETNGNFTRVDFTACSLTVEAGADILNPAPNGVNEFRVGGAMLVEAGATITADETTGQNVIRHRDAAIVPELLGTITPVPRIEHSTVAGSCPLCGNATVDGNESCDDGNTVAGDGCNSECQSEACVAQTPGYPNVPLCDDGISCTQDVCRNDVCERNPVQSVCDDGDFCNGAEDCDPGSGCIAGPPVDCSDGIDCTTDTCDSVRGLCENTVNHTACDDGEFCTGVELCDAAAGCLVAASLPCDDQIDCTDDDCDEANRACSFTPNHGFCDDGDACTEDVCEQAVGCMSTAQQVCDIVCGDATGDGRVTTTDALLILRAAVANDPCDLRSCDANNTGSVTTTDALAVLQFAVGALQNLNCPS